MNYSPYPVPLRAPLTDIQGHLSRPWIDFLTQVSRKAGRSVTWRGVYSDSLDYAVCDVVSLESDNSLWIAKQGQPINGTATTPGTEEAKDADKRIWELILRPGEASNGIPVGGTTGQILAKHSGTNYDTEWIDAPTGGGGGVTLPIAESDVTGLVADLAAKVPTTRTVATTSPLTGGGDLSADRTISLGTQSANQVLAGPTTGSAAAPAFRALVAADIPAIAEAGVTNLVSDLALKAPLASPAFTGNPTAPTPSPGDNDTSIATTAFVAAAITSGVSGVVVPSTEAGASHQFLTAYNSTTGVFSKAQPASSDLSDATDIRAGVLGIVIDGSGFVPSLGSKGFLQCPYGGTITGWTLLADQSGSAQITVKKSTYSGFPTTSSIVASAQPSLSSAQKATSTTLTGWTTTITAGDVIEFNLDSVTTCTRLILSIQVTKS